MEPTNQPRPPLACPFCGDQMEPGSEKGIWRHPGSQMLAEGCFLRGYRYPAEVWNSRPPTSEPLDERVFRAVIDCGHVIKSSAVSLFFEPSKPGHNALNQLHDRIRGALAGFDAAPNQEQTISEVSPR